jgi:hypothetical protein
MALNLSRNSKVFFTTNVDATTGVVDKTNFSAANTFEIQVLDGFSFSQSTSNETITVSEAGSAPVRGQRAFNTALEPASFSFSTYLRPGKAANGTTITSEDAPLWNAMFGTDSLHTAYIRVVPSGATYTEASNQLVLTMASTTGFTAGQVVRVTGITGATVGGTAYTSTSSDTTIVGRFNSLARVSSVSVGVSVTLVYLVKPTSATAATFIFDANTAFVVYNAVALNAAAATNLSYVGTTGQLSISGGAYTFLGAAFVAGQKFVVSGIDFIDGTAPLAGTSLGYSTPTIAEIEARFNSAVTVVSTGTTLVLQYETKPYSDSLTSTALGSGESINLFTNCVPVLYKSSWASGVSDNRTSGGTNTFADWFAQATSNSSNLNQLQKFGMVFLIDQVTYAIDNCVLNEVTVDFGIDAIATASWSGQGTSVRQISTNLVAAVTNKDAYYGSFTGTVSDVAGGTTTSIGNYYNKNIDAGYITNKLSTCVLTVQKAMTKVGSGSVSAGTSYTVPLTGGSITISNNVTYVTPSALGVVNQPLTYFTGARSITGTLNAYLKTGTTNATGNLLSDMLSVAANTVEPVVGIALDIGGSSNKTRAMIDLPFTVLSVPNVDVQQVVSMSVGFNAQGYDNISSTNAYSIEKNNDFAIRYYAE